MQILLIRDTNGCNCRRYGKLIILKLPNCPCFDKKKSSGLCNFFRASKICLLPALWACDEKNFLRRLFITEMSYAPDCLNSDLVVLIFYLSFCRFPDLLISIESMKVTHCQHRFYFDVHKVCGKLRQGKTADRVKLHWLSGKDLFFQWIWTRYVYFYISLWQIMPSSIKKPVHRMTEITANDRNFL